MAEKINLSAEGDVDREAVARHYDIEMQQLLCDRLAVDNAESERERRQRRRIGLAVAWVGGVVPLLALGALYKMMMDYPEYFFGEMNSAVPPAVLISASFLSMVVIYAFLIKGMFPGTQKMTQITYIPLLMRQ